MKLIIDRKRWGRGTGSGYLLDNGSGLMCCLGFYCKALGLTDDEIRNHEMPGDLERDITGSGSWLINRFENKYKASTGDAYTLAKINDNPDISEEDREQKIKETFAVHDIEVEFTD